MTLDNTLLAGGIVVVCVGAWLGVTAIDVVDGEVQIRSWRATAGFAVAAAGLATMAVAMLTSPLAALYLSVAALVSAWGCWKSQHGRWLAAVRRVGSTLRRAVAR